MSRSDSVASLMIELLTGKVTQCLFKTKDTKRTEESVTKKSIMQDKKCKCNVQWWKTFN